MKVREGRRLEQPEPGVLASGSPPGRKYGTGSAAYAA